MQIYYILQSIEAASGTNEKKVFLRELLNDSDGEKFIRIVFSKIIYGVSKKSFEKIIDTEIQETFADVGLMLYHASSTKNSTSDWNLGQLASFLDDLTSLSGNDAIAHLRKLLEVDRLQRKWIARLIMKDLSCGIGLPSVNDVLLELGKEPIEKFEVQLCGKFNMIEDYDLGFPVYAGIKYDGFRAIIEKVGDNITITSRQGKNVDFVPEICDELRKYRKDFIVDGEILAKNFNEIQKRIGRKADNLLDVTGLHFRIFDILSIDNQILDNKPIQERFWIIEHEFSESPLLKFEERKLITSQQELEDFYNDACSRKEEGIIIKLMDKPYDYGGRDNWFKVKPVMENSFRVIGWNKGNGKFKDTIGSLIVSNDTGTIKAKVGSGIKDSIRERLQELIDEDKILGLIVDVKYFEVTKNKEGSQSLRFPRLIKLRMDKAIAD